VILFKKEIKPKKFSYSKQSGEAIPFDNGTIRKRNEIQGFIDVSVSFLMNVEELTYFNYFYETEINNGEDTFEAYWDTRKNRFTIISEILYTYNEGTNELCEVSFNVSYQLRECDVYRKQLLVDINRELSILTWVDPDFLNFKGCDKNREMMNFLVDEELAILSLGFSEAGQYYFSEGLVVIDEVLPTDCDVVVDDLVSAIDVELSALGNVAPSPLVVANVSFEAIIKKIGDETEKHREVMTK